jgi:hypothetical protein
MKRSPLKRKTPLRSNPSKTLEWKQRSSKRLPSQSIRRRREETSYSNDRPAFIRSHPTCPVTGGRTVQLHHSAKREGLWLNLKRYWIAVSNEGHRIIEDHKGWAEEVGLMVRIRETAETHIKNLTSKGVDLERPVFYDNWNGEILWSKQ